MEVSLITEAVLRHRQSKPVSEETDGEEAYLRLKNFIIGLGEGYTIIDKDVADGLNGGMLKDGAWCAGREIFVGEFSDTWCKVVALAHEVGHSCHENNLIHTFLDAPKKRDNIEHSTLILEAMCWQYGYSLLEALKIECPYHAVVWAGEQLGTYAGYNG